MRRITLLVAALLLVLSAAGNAATIGPQPGPVPCRGSFGGFQYPSPSTTSYVHIPITCGTQRDDFYGLGTSSEPLNGCPAGGDTTVTYEGTQTPWGGTGVPATWTISTHNGVATVNGADARGHRWFALGAWEPTLPLCYQGATLTGYETGDSSQPPTLMRCRSSGTVVNAQPPPYRETSTATSGSGSCQGDGRTWQMTYDGEWHTTSGTGTCAGNYWVYVRLLDPATGQRITQVQDWIEGTGTTRTLKVEVSSIADEVRVLTVGRGSLTVDRDPCLGGTRTTQENVTFLLVR